MFYFLFLTTVALEIFLLALTLTDCEILFSRFTSFLRTLESFFDIFGSLLLVFFEGVVIFNFARVLRTASSAIWRISFLVIFCIAALFDGKRILEWVNLMNVNTPFSELTKT